MSPMSPELKAFYIALAVYINNGCPRNDSGFSHFYGLCSSLTEFGWTFNLESQFNEQRISRLTELRYEMKAQWDAEGLNREYPFNTDGDDYCVEKDRYRKDGKRYEWVMRHALIAIISEL